MIKSVIFVKYPDNINFAEAETWFVNKYTQEAKKLSGLKRFLAYKVLEYPQDIDKIMPGRKRYNWLLEFWYDDFAAWKRANLEERPRFTDPPGGRSFIQDWEMVFMEDKPDKCFVGKDLSKEQRGKFLRAVWLVNFELPATPDTAPERLPWGELEAWYLSYHAVESAGAQKLLRRYVSYRCLGYAYYRISDPLGRFGFRHQVRFTEQWYDDFDSWRKSVIDNPPKFTSPSGGWGVMRGWQTAFTWSHPTYDLLTEVPVPERRER